jgi:hypothetical protein
LLRKYSTTKATPPALFTFVIFKIGSHIYASAGLYCNLIFFSRHTYHYSQLLVKMRVLLWTFYPGWAGTITLLISIFQVARITGMSYSALLYFLSKCYLQVTYLKRLQKSWKWIDDNMRKHWSKESNTQLITYQVHFKTGSITRGWKWLLSYCSGRCNNSKHIHQIIVPHKYIKQTLTKTKCIEVKYINGINQMGDFDMASSVMNIISKQKLSEHTKMWT